MMIHVRAAPRLSEKLRPGPVDVGRRGGVLIWLLPALAAVTIALAWVIAPSSPQSPHNENPPTSGEGPSIQTKSGTPTVSANAPTNPESARSETQDIVVGEWTGYYQGQRRLTVRKDGTATMTVEPEGLGAILLAPKLTFDARWTIKDGHFEFETVGGTPLDKVNVVVKMYGRRRSHKILEMKPQKIVLQDEDGATEYVWISASIPESTP